MRKTIHTFPLTSIGDDGNIRLMMPVGAQILAVQVQGDVPTIYALVPIDQENQTLVLERRFRVVGQSTVCPIVEHPEHLHYIGTFQLHAGDFVGHLFEVR